MDDEIENGKIINKMIPKAIGDSKIHAKEIKKRIKLNEIFSEFENKASNELNFFLDESNRRYTKSKCGINLNTLIASTRKKCLNESIKILNDNFYNNSIIEEERIKMGYKSGKKGYKKIKNTLNIVRNPEIKRKELYLEEINKVNKELEQFGVKENNKNEFLENNDDNDNNNRTISYNKKYEPKNRDKDRKKMNEIINDEYQSIYKSLDNYKTSLKTLKYKYDGSKKMLNEKDSYISLKKKYDFYLPKLKFLEYAQKKLNFKNNNDDDEKKKVDIHKLLPYSKYAKYFYNINPKNTSSSKSKNKQKKDKTLPYITEPNIPDNTYYYKNYNNTINVVADSANKEIFVNKNFDKKRNDIENILGVDDIPELNYYEKIAHEKAYSQTKKRREKNELISKQQNYLKLTSKQRINFNIERNLNLIKNVENSLWNQKKNDISNDINK